MKVKNQLFEQSIFCHKYFGLILFLQNKFLQQAIYIDVFLIILRYHAIYDIINILQFKLLKKLQNIYKKEHLLLNLEIFMYFISL